MAHSDTNWDIETPPPARFQSFPFPPHDIVQRSCGIMRLEQGGVGLIWPLGQRPMVLSTASEFVSDSFLRSATKCCFATTLVSALLSLMKDARSQRAECHDPVSFGYTLPMLSWAIEGSAIGRRRSANRGSPRRLPHREWTSPVPQPTPIE